MTIAINKHLSLNISYSHNTNFYLKYILMDQNMKLCVMEIDIVMDR